MTKTTDDLVIRISDTEEYRFSMKQFLNAEAITAEKKTRLTWAEIVIGVNTGMMLSITAVVWLIRRRAEPKLTFEEVVFDTGVDVIDPDTDPRYAEPDEDDAGDEGEPEVPKEAAPEAAPAD